MTKLASRQASAEAGAAQRAARGEGRQDLRADFLAGERPTSQGRGNSATRRQWHGVARSGERDSVRPAGGTFLCRDSLQKGDFRDPHPVAISPAQPSPAPRNSGSASSGPEAAISQSDRSGKVIIARRGEAQRRKKVIRCRKGGRPGAGAARWLARSADTHSAKTLRTSAWRGWHWAAVRAAWQARPGVRHGVPSIYGPHARRRRPRRLILL